MIVNGNNYKDIKQPKLRITGLYMLRRSLKLPFRMCESNNSNQAANHLRLAANHPRLAANHPRLAANHPRLAATKPPVAATKPPVAATRPPLAANYPDWRPIKQNRISN
jgi:hypothetical protein